jgi:hypothetical protein
MTMTTHTPDSTDSTTTVLVIPMYELSDPDAPISDGQKALLKRFAVRFRSNTTKGQASARLHRFFTDNPAVYLEYVAEKKRKAQQWWADRKREFIALAASRSREMNRVPASEKQINYLMSVAFARKDLSRRLVAEAHQLLNYGALAAFASEFLDRIPPRPQQAEQMN